MYPHLDLDSISIDWELAKQLPRRLAYYHLAIPIAKEGDTLTVAVANPDNQRVLALLAAVLNAEIVPVRGSEAAITRALNRLWPPARIDTPRHILVWSADADRNEAHRARFTSLLPADSYGLTALQPSAATLDSLPDFVRDGRYDLLVTDRLYDNDLRELLGRSPASVLFCDGPARPIRRILVLLRGHQPDQTALDWLMPVAAHTGASVTLLMIARSDSPYYMRRPLTDFLLPDAEAGAHLAHYARMVNAHDIPGRVKIREGSPEACTAAELNAATYDLIITVAEAYGDFIVNLLAMLDSAASWDGLTMIVKPNQDGEDNASDENAE